MRECPNWRERLLTLVILCFINRREILLCRWVESAPRETIKACLVLNPVGEAGVTEHAVAAEGRRDATRREKGAVSAVSPAEEFRDSLFGGITSWSVVLCRSVVYRSLPCSYVRCGTLLSSSSFSHSVEQYSLLACRPVLFLF